MCVIYHIQINLTESQIKCTDMTAFLIVILILSLPFRIPLHFEFVLMYKVGFILDVVIIFHVFFIFKVVLIFGVVFILRLNTFLKSLSFEISE